MSSSAAALQPEPWPASSLLRRTVAVVDMVGYSDIARILEENIGPAAVTELNRQIQAFMLQALAQMADAQPYCVVAKTGDGIIILFDSANDAHAFGTNVHLIAGEHNTGRTEATAQRWFRVGVATGVVSATVCDSHPSEYAGTTIANAVRLEGAAKAGQVLADSATYNAFSREVGALYGPEEWAKGKRAERFRAHRLQVIPCPEATTQSTQPGFRGRRVLLSVASTLAVVLVALLVQRSASSFTPRHDPPAAAKWWYDQGVHSLREGANTKATNELEKAVEVFPGYVMAHARLAEAWEHQDFQGKAEREMVKITPSDERRASPLEQKYLAAIRANLTQDYPTSLALYRKIVDLLPEEEKPDGYIDVGDAYEQVGDHAHALENYQHAARLYPAMPAANLRIARAKGNLHDLAGAEQALKKVESMFTTEQNMEGLAELDWQRGYIAVQRSDYPEASADFEKARATAVEIKDIQLEVRSLTELSRVAYLSDDYDKSIALAQKAILLARDNMLEVWAAAGFVRMSVAEYSKRDFSAAEEAVQTALHLTQQQQGRQDEVEALAKATLASLRDQQHRPREVYAPAEDALRYYQKHGNFDYIFRTLLVLTRADVAVGNAEGALKRSSQLIEQAARTGNTEFIAQAQETTGNVFQGVEDYPKALVHFEAAWDAATAGDTKYLEAEHCAEVSLLLGRFAEFNRYISLIPPASTAFADTSEMQLDSLVARRRYKDAALFARRALNHTPEPSSDAYPLERSLAIAEAHLGHRQAATSAMKRAEELGASSATASDKVEDQLAQVEVALGIGQAEEAYSSAESTYKSLLQQGLHASALRSASLAYEAAVAQHHTEDVKTSLAEIASETRYLRAAWGNETVRGYLATLLKIPGLIGQLAT